MLAYFRGKSIEWSSVLIDHKPSWLTVTYNYCLCVFIYSKMPYLIIQNEVGFVVCEQPQKQLFYFARGVQSPSRVTLEAASV